MRSNRLGCIGIVAVVGLLCAEAKSATLHVPKQYKKIQSAIKSARPGDTVLVESGIYKERIRLTSGVTLRSAGDDSKGSQGLKRAEKTIIDGGGDKGSSPGVIMAEAATLDGFTVTNVGLFDETEWKKHHATRGEDLPDEQGAAGMKGNIPAVAVIGIDCVVTNNVVHHNGNVGVAVVGTRGKICTSIIALNTVYRNMGGGIGVANGAQPIVRQNRCFENLRAGIGCRNASPLILQNECYENIRAGVGNREGSKGVLRGNKCYRNRRAGIGMRMKGTTPIVEDNECYENDMAGIGSRDGASPIIRNNRCYKNKMAGIGSREGASPIIRNNHCYENQMAGIGSKENARPLIVGNVSEKNAMAGIGVRDKAVAVIRQNKCIDNKLVAIGVIRGASADIAGNKLSRQGGAPPLVAVKEASATLRNNSFHGGGVAAVLVQGTAFIDGNQFFGRGKKQGSAVWVWKGSHVAISDNRFDGYRNAINASESTITATKNEIRNFQSVAIVIRQPTTAANVFGNSAWSADPKASVVSIDGKEGTVGLNRLNTPDKKSR